MPLSVSAPHSSSACTLQVEHEAQSCRLVFSGRMDAQSLGALWQEATQAAAQSLRTAVDLRRVVYFDGAGVGLLLDLQRTSKSPLEVEGLPEEFQPLLAPFPDLQMPEDLHPPRRSLGFITSLGKITLAFVQDVREQIAFLGEVLVLFLRLLRHPGLLRWREVMVIFRQVGVDALGIVGLIGFLMGLILAFQSAAPLQQFGVDLFVVNLVALAMLRELGVIMTAIVLAGRSGSAFAAEIGTMKVNEEINALLTMGLDPARFLVLPRVLAGVLAMPLLTIYGNVVGIFGGLLVVTSFGHSWASVWNQLMNAADLSDVATGMMKSVVFGFLIASVGCLRGLQTKNGALAVGESTTRSVVASIVLIIFSDMIFALVFYAIGF